MTSAPVLSVRGLRIEFPVGGDRLVAARDVSFELAGGECLAIVGESGSGKSVTCLGLLGLVPGQGRVVAGEVIFEGDDLLKLPFEGLRQVRGEKIAMIFQDPSSALNPLFTIERQIRDVLDVHKDWPAKRKRDRILEVLGAVGFPDPARRMKSYPHELSGGLRQRVAIALALACAPRIVIADEATTNLDVSVQAQIIELLVGLKDDLEFSVIFVTHDLALAQHIADRVMVMYAGHPVEVGPVAEVMANPAHPYTVGLLGSAPTGESHRAHRLAAIPGSIPDLRTIGAAAPFAGRCPVRVEGICDRVKPAWTSCGADHLVACHRYERDGREGTTWNR